MLGKETAGHVDERTRVMKPAAEMLDIIREVQDTVPAGERRFNFHGIGDTDGNQRFLYLHKRFIDIYSDLQNEPATVGEYPGLNVYALRGLLGLPSGTLDEVIELGAEIKSWHDLTDQQIELRSRLVRFHFTDIEARFVADVASYQNFRDKYPNLFSLDTE